MKTKPYPIAMKSACVCSSFLCASMLLVGCTGSKVKGPRSENLEHVRLNDFVNENTTEQAASSPPRTSSTTQETPAIREIPSDGITLTARPPSFEPATEPTTSISPVHSSTNRSLKLLDAKIGDVNGKPIFTNSFFEPIEDRLLTEASRLSGDQWLRSAHKLILNRLNGIITDELLRSEALTSLTPNQRVGLQAFLSNFRNDLLSKNLGSSQLASRRIQQEQGVTLDQALQQKEIDTLVQLTLIQEVNKRVNVSWRDIKQRYEHDIDKYSPPPTAIFYVVRAFSDNAEKIATIQTKIDAGENFVAIAASKLNNYNTETQGLHSVVIEESFETTNFFGPDALNEQTQQLSMGQVAGPINLSSTVYWVKLIEIKQDSVSLYDAQLQIQRDLTYERRTKARNDYLARLIERAKVSSRDEVLMRLLEIAEERYGPQG